MLTRHTSHSHTRHPMNWKRNFELLDDYKYKGIDRKQKRKKTTTTALPFPGILRIQANQPCHRAPFILVQLGTITNRQGPSVDSLSSGLPRFHPRSLPSFALASCHDGGILQSGKQAFPSRINRTQKRFHKQTAVQIRTS